MELSLLFSRQIIIDKMTSDEACAAGDESLHYTNFMKIACRGQTAAIQEFKAKS
jgi:hypothetical protein